jgi:hypothetical protein
MRARRPRVIDNEHLSTVKVPVRAVTIRRLRTLVEVGSIDDQQVLMTVGASGHDPSDNAPQRMITPAAGTRHGGDHVETIDLKRSAQASLMPA